MRRLVEVLKARGRAVAEAVRSTGETDVIYLRRRPYSSPFQITGLVSFTCSDELWWPPASCQNGRFKSAV